MVAILLPDKIDLNIKAIRTDKEGSDNSTSVYLFEETQNTKSKTNVSLHCGTVSNSQTRWKQLQHPSIDGPRSAARVQRNTTRP